MPDTILVVEDEPTLLETLEYNLSRQGYHVLTAADGRAAVDVALEERPDLIVLDVMLPELDGFEVCRIVRQEMNVPILMLTARTEEIDKVLGLEMGADDYLTKPFSMRELMARAKALLRRVRLIREEMIREEPSEPDDDDTLCSQDLRVDPGRRQVFRDDKPLALKPKEYDLLLYFIRNKGMALSREQILDRVWGWDYVASQRTVDVHVRWLREKIEDDPGQPTRIVTVRTVGYRFEG